MKFIRKIRYMFVVCSIFIMTVIAMNINVFAVEKTWQEAYLEAMDSYEPYDKSFCECRLVYLDDDNIPEFYMGDPLNEWYGGIYSFSGGELIKLRDFGFRDFFSAYSEESGIFRNDYYIERSGSKTGIKFIKMENLSLTVLDELSHDVVNDIYEVNGEVVDKEVYNNKISEYSLVNASSDYLTYDAMKKYLLDSMESENNNKTDEPITTETTETENITDEPTTTETAKTENIPSNEEISTNVNYNTKHASSPKTGDSEPIFCELVVIGFISASTIMLLRKKYKKIKNNI